MDLSILPPFEGFLFFSVFIFAGKHQGKATQRWKDKKLTSFPILIIRYLFIERLSVTDIRIDECNHAILVDEFRRRRRGKNYGLTSLAKEWK